MKKLILTAAILLAGCNAKQSADTATPPAPAVDQQAAQMPAYQNAQQPAQTESQSAPVWRHDYRPPAPQQVVSVYIDPPLEQPQPVRVAWAPPPMLVETPPPPPSDEAVWTGGYWAWQGDWVWAHGRWAAPPHHGYRWNNPYYEHRDGTVIFVNGFWARPGTSFVAPAANLNIALAVAAIGIVAGLRPEGPNGVFVPPPPGSHAGLIVPAPIGTPPAVVIGAPPIIHEGMHVTVNNNVVNSNNSVNNVTNVTNVTIVAPASSTATGRAVNSVAPAQPHLAAAQIPVVNAIAPTPGSTRPIQSHQAGAPPAVLPPAQTVIPEMPRHPQQAPEAPQRPAAQGAAHTEPAAPAAPAHTGHDENNRDRARPNTASPPPATGQEHRPDNEVKPVPAAPAPAKAAEPAGLARMRSDEDSQRRPEPSQPERPAPAPQPHPEHHAEDASHPRPDASRPAHPVKQPHPATETTKPAPVDHAMPAPKNVAPGAGHPQPNEEMQHKPETKKPKEEGKPDEKREHDHG